MILTLVIVCLLLWFLGLMTSYTSAAAAHPAGRRDRAVPGARHPGTLCRQRLTSYDSRSAVSGSMRVAREDGIAIARSATAVRSSDTQT